LTVGCRDANLNRKIFHNCVDVMRLGSSFGLYVFD